MRKYKIGKIRHLICTDIAETSLSQAENRYKEMESFSQNASRPSHFNNRGWNRGYHSDLFTAEFIAADATKDCLRDRFKDPNVKIDMVSVQFSFHYCFESLPQVERMLQNISNNLVDGGYFIGTTPDSNEVLRRVRESGHPKEYTPSTVPSQQSDQGQSDRAGSGSKETDVSGQVGQEAESDPNFGHFGNDIYNVRFKEGVLRRNPDGSIQAPLFGAEYKFHLEEVVDCPEFLVHFPCLEKLASKYGLKLVYKQRFDQFYHRMMVASRDGKDLLKKMKALETYPGCNVGTASDDYTHAQLELDRIKEHSQSERNGSDRGSERRGRVPTGFSLGTLSKSEWEAITLYLVFMFQKNPESRRDSGRREERESKR